jgi:hypothetical protein
MTDQQPEHDGPPPIDEDTRIRLEARFNPKATRNHEAAEKALARVEQPASDDLPADWTERPFPDADTKLGALRSAAEYFQLTVQNAAQLDGANVREIADNAAAIAQKQRAESDAFWRGLAGIGPGSPHTAVEDDPIRAAVRGGAVNEIQTATGTRFTL